MFDGKMAGEVAEMCIYYGDKPGLTYNSREHVFPAGLGGKMMLPQGMVSDQANHYFSGLESRFMHSSLIALERALFGPGSRGSLDPGKAGKAYICFGNDSQGNHRLSYTSFGQPYIIPQIVCDKGNKRNEISFPDDGRNIEEKRQDFDAVLRKFDGKYTYIQADVADVAVVGIYDGKIIISCREPVNKDKAELLVKGAVDMLEKNTDARYESVPNSIRQKYILGENVVISKVYAKVAINVLSLFLKDKPEILMDETTDIIKQWILSDATDHDYTYLEVVNDKHGLYYLAPEMAHWCLLLNMGGRLVAVVTFYNHLSRLVDLGKIPEGWNPIPQGMICDWKNRIEYDVADYIVKWTMERNVQARERS